MKMKMKMLTVRIGFALVVGCWWVWVWVGMLIRGSFDVLLLVVMLFRKSEKENKAKNPLC